MHKNYSGSIEYPERFARTVAFYGDPGFAQIRRARVAVIGLGGVGSHAALALARSGIGKLFLVDHDQLTATSLNRHPVAGPDDVGEYKAELLTREIQRVCPNTEVESNIGFFHVETAAELLSPVPDYLIDAIDSRNPKATLLEYCVNNSISVASSMGASARRDVSFVKVSDLSRTKGCPLARQLRKLLRNRGIEKGIQCVYSLEKSPAVLPPDLNDISLDRGRVRNLLPSQISLPGVFGYALAAVALEHIAADTK